MLKVDRKQFLALTATLAAASCGKKATPGPENPNQSFDTTQKDTIVVEAPNDETEQSEDEELVEEQTVSDEPTVASGDCDDLKPPGPVCESFAHTKTQCSAFAKVLVPEAAGAALACIKGRSGQPTVCGINVPGDCALEGAQAVPKTATAKNACRKLAQRCGRRRGWNTAACESAVSGYRSEVQDKLISCIGELCDADCFFRMTYIAKRPSSDGNFGW